MAESPPANTRPCLLITPVCGCRALEWRACLPLCLGGSVTTVWCGAGNLGTLWVTGHPPQENGVQGSCLNLTSVMGPEMCAQRETQDTRSAAQLGKYRSPPPSRLQTRLVVKVLRFNQCQCPQQRAAAQDTSHSPLTAPPPLPLTSGHTVNLPGHAQKTEQ